MQFRKDRAADAETAGLASGCGAQKPLALRARRRRLIAIRRNSFGWRRNKEPAAAGFCKKLSAGAARAQMPFALCAR